MKVVPQGELERSAWDEVADCSSAAWLFHRSAWIDIETRFAAKGSFSFAIIDDGGQAIGIQPLYRRNVERGWVERVLDSGYHRHAGLALRDGLPESVQQAAIQLAMAHIFAEAARLDVDRILLNMQNVAPAVLASRTQELPFWIQHFGFERGLHLSPLGDRAVPGLSNVFADQIVCLDPSRDELFSNLESACQRAIRKAQRHELTFEHCCADPIREYYELANLSRQRTGESLAPESYYQAIWKELGRQQRAAMLFARHEGKLVAAVFLAIDKGAASYLGGISHPDYLNMRVNDFVHWQALCWAKDQGLRYYRLGPVFPELPAHWPVCRVSHFKSKFGGQSYPVIQGNYYCKPERYRQETLLAAEQACDMRIQQVAAARQADRARNADPARDLVVVLRRYGFLAIDPRSRANELLKEHGIWWSGCATPLRDLLDRLNLIVHPDGHDLEALGIHCHREQGKELFYAGQRWTWWLKKPAYQALLPHTSFSGPGIEPIWHNRRGRAVLAWLHWQGRKILLAGLNLVDELVRYTQGDTEQLHRDVDRARFNLPFERADYLFDTNLLPGSASIPWADRLGFAVVRCLGEVTQWPLVEPFPEGASGLVLLTMDGAQALPAKWQQAELGRIPITYFLPTGTNPAPLMADMPASVEIGLRVDALDQPDLYEAICARQAAALRSGTSRPVRTVRNHGFLNGGYLGHVRAWEECGLTLDMNYAGVDGTALTGSFLPFRVRRADGTWSGHFSLLTTFSHDMLPGKKAGQAHACRRIKALARQIERSHPGVLAFSMHPQDMSDATGAHRQVLALGRRRGWLALGVETYLQWLERWQTLTLRRDGGHLTVHGPQAVDGVVLQVPAGRGWRRVSAPVLVDQQKPSRRAG